MRAEEREAQGWERVRPGVWRRDAGDDDEYAFCCQVCQRDTEIEDEFMVRNDLWLEVMQPADRLGGIICLGCFEERLGRGVTLEDLTPFPINAPHRARLGYEAPRCLQRLDAACESLNDLTSTFVYLSSPRGILVALQRSEYVSELREALRSGELTMHDAEIWLREVFVEHEEGYQLPKQAALAALLIALHAEGHMHLWLRMFRQVCIPEAVMLSRVLGLLGTGEE